MDDVTFANEGKSISMQRVTSLRRRAQASAPATRTLWPNGTTLPYATMYVPPRNTRHSSIYLRITTHTTV